jgi:hypothetical protein
MGGRSPQNTKKKLNFGGNTHVTLNPKPSRYDPGIMGVMLWAVGCLTRKNTQQRRAVFVDLFHFLLLFLLCVSFVIYFLLLKGVRFVIFCYFFLLFVTLINYFLLLKRAKVFIILIV